MAVASVWIGLTFSYVLPKWPPSFSIIAVASAIYVATILASSLGARAPGSRRLSRLRPVPKSLPRSAPALRRTPSPVARLASYNTSVNTAAIRDPRAGVLTAVAATAVLTGALAPFQHDVGLLNEGLLFLLLTLPSRPPGAGGSGSSRRS